MFDLFPMVTQSINFNTYVHLIVTGDWKCDLSNRQKRIVASFCFLRQSLSWILSYTYDVRFEGGGEGVR